MWKALEEYRMSTPQEVEQFIGQSFGARSGAPRSGQTTRDWRCDSRYVFPDAVLLPSGCGTFGCDFEPKYFYIIHVTRNEYLGSRTFGAQNNVFQNSRSDMNLSPVKNPFQAYFFDEIGIKCTVFIRKCTHIVLHKTLEAGSRYP